MNIIPCVKEHNDKCELNENNYIELLYDVKTIYF